MVGLSGLRRKLLRDIFASRAQYLAVVFIIVLGVAIFIASFAAYQNLYSSYDNSYQRLGMADYWISLDRISSKAGNPKRQLSPYMCLRPCLASSTATLSESYLQQR